MSADRERYSLERLSELGSRLMGASEMIGTHPLSVYVTGSYGRLEAWSGSDIDLFFLHGGEKKEFPYTTFIRAAAEIVQATEEMKFPPFTGDGKYLEVHYVGQMEKVLGSPADDYCNAFTARMLLLLESRPLINDVTYESLLSRVLGFYFRDFADHQDAFMPVFLQNDILRFWRTLTLNYEHGRVELIELTGEELQREKAESALKNVKLKFSRLSTCFSMVAHLSSATPPVTLEQVRALCHSTPAQRFEELRGRSSKADELIDSIERQYGDFLVLTQKDKPAVIETFSEPELRKQAQAQASNYGETIYELLQEITPAERLRYLVI